MFRNGRFIKGHLPFIYRLDKLSTNYRLNKWLGDLVSVGVFNFIEVDALEKSGLVNFLNQIQMICGMGVGAEEIVVSVFDQPLGEFLGAGRIIPAQGQ